MIESPSFRILIIDDDIYKHVDESSDWSSGHSSLTGQHCDFVDHWLALKGSSVEIVLAADAALRKVFTLTLTGKIPHDGKTLSDGRKNPPKVTDPESWLVGFHIVVLDMKGIGAPRDEDTLETLVRSHVEAIRATNDNTKIFPLLADEEVQGVKFYHRYLDHFKSARALIVLTGQDLGHQNTPAGIRNLLWPFCRDENDLPVFIPWTIVHGKPSNPGRRINRLIQSLYEDFTKGYEMLTNRGQIEFAAVTDEPVLILGESGTGKEYVATAIKRAWEREKDAVQRTERGFEVLNCGCITDATAHAHMFGSVRGAVPGSSAHEPGVILQAAGCRALGYEMPDKPYEEHLKAALARAEEAASKVEKLGTEQDHAKFFTLGRQYLADLRELLYPKKTSQNGPASTKHSLPQVLEDVKTHLQNLLAGTAEADQFKHKLLAHFQGRLEQDPDSSNPFDLQFKADTGALGTLFLDEFADLPPLAQSLLLRFLESGTQEIQPLGYPGRISGVKLRIIAATSDDEVARKAGLICEDDKIRKQGTGETVFKKRPDGRARSFPVRFDLVQRLRYHTIRVEPVTTDNARRTIESMIRTKDGVEWDAGGIEALEAYTKEQAEKATFNHRRELRRIMDLASLHVTKGHQRGLRGFEANRVTKEVVSRFLIPASAVTPAPAMVENLVPPLEDVTVTTMCQTALQDMAEVLKGQGLECQFQCGEELASLLKQKIQKCSNPAKAKGAVRKALKPLTEKKGAKGTKLKYKVLIKMFGFDVDEKNPVGKVRDFFNKTNWSKEPQTAAKSAGRSGTARKQPKTDA